MKNFGKRHQYACFSCRKSFKRLRFDGISKKFMTREQIHRQIQEARTFENSRIYKCPNCAKPSHFMGIDFKAPKKTDIKAWLKVQEFIESGKIYYRGTLR